MKISVSLPEQDVAFLDSLGKNRSAGIAEALQALRRSKLDAEYTGAFQEWEESGEESAWSGTSADGIAQ